MCRINLLIYLYLICKGSYLFLDWCLSPLVMVCGHKSHNATNCPSLNNLGLYSPTPFSATVFIRFLTQGCIKDKYVWGDLFSNSSAGVLSVVTWGVLWYPARNLTFLDSRLNDLTLLFKACFTVHTKFSATPFGDGWYGGIHLYMNNAICLHKNLILNQNEGRSVVWEQYHWNIMCCKYCSQFINHLSHRSSSD